MAVDETLRLIASVRGGTSPLEAAYHLWALAWRLGQVTPGRHLSRLEERAGRRVDRLNRMYEAAQGKRLDELDGYTRPEGPDRWP